MIIAQRWKNQTESNCLQNHFTLLGENVAAGFFDFLKDCFEREICIFTEHGFTLLDVSAQAGAFNMVV